MPWRRLRCNVKYDVRYDVYKDDRGPIQSKRLCKRGWSASELDDIWDLARLQGRRLGSSGGIIPGKKG